MALGDKKVTLDGLRAVYQHIDGNINDLKSALYRTVPVNFSELELIKGYVGSNLKWSSGNGNGYHIPVTGKMKKVTVTANDNYGAAITFLSSTTLTSGELVGLTSTLGRESISVGETKAFDIPSDCVLIIVQKKPASAANNEPASMVFDVLISEAADNEEVQAQISAINSKFPMPEIVVPYIFRWCVGKQLNVYYQNCVKNFDIRKAMYASVSAFTSFSLFARYQPSQVATGKGGNFKVYPYNLTDGISATIHYGAVAADSGSGLTKNVLLIGDSLTANQPLSKHLIDDLFAEDAMSINLVGTRGSAPYLREGRSGWSPTDYVHKESVDDVSNAFFNPTSQTFDFSYYMTQNKDAMGFASASDDVDYVFLNLGTNISSEGYDVTVADMIADMETMVQSILAYAAAQNRTIRIGVWTPPPRALVSNANLPDHNNTMTRVKAIIDAFDRRESENIHVVPVGYNVDPYHDFDTQTVNVSVRNSRYQMDVLVGGDFTHPADEGYFKMADVIYCMIKYFGSLET